VSTTRAARRIGSSPCIINIPIGIVGFLIARRTLHESRVPGRGLDVAGQLTALVGLGSVTYALIDGAARGGRPR
jgi:MFS transporter, DHA2 family, methylenomycin A resistance protein